MPAAEKRSPRATTATTAAATSAVKTIMKLCPKTNKGKGCGQMKPAPDFIHRVHGRETKHCRDCNDRNADECRKQRRTARKQKAEAEGKTEEWFQDPGNWKTCANCGWSNQMMRFRYRAKGVSFLEANYCETCRDRVHTPTYKEKYNHGLHGESADVLNLVPDQAAEPVAEDPKGSSKPKKQAAKKIEPASARLQSFEKYLQLFNTSSRSPDGSGIARRSQTMATRVRSQVFALPRKDLRNFLQRRGHDLDPGVPKESLVLQIFKEINLSSSMRFRND